MQTANINSYGDREQSCNNISGMRCQIASITDKGRGKQENQDNLLTKSGESTLGYCMLLAVADGVGGLECGAEASTAAINCLRLWWNITFRSIMYSDMENIQYLINESLSAAIDKVNREIYERGIKENRRMATTLSVVFVLNGWYCVKHIGDSRVYLISRKLEQITEDHNLLSQQLKSGTFDETKCSFKGLNNVLTKCLGAKADIELFEQTGHISEKEGFLLCTDGLYKLLSVTEIGRELGIYHNHAEDMQQGIQFLINKARKRGERDDISVIMMKVKRKSKSDWKSLKELVTGRSY